jgi:allantoin racemase
VKQPGTQVVYRFCTWGMETMEPAFYSYIDHLASRLVYHAAVSAEQEGFDGVVTNCFGDPMLWELRLALDIPVVGLGESAMLFSTMMGLDFGIVHISPYNIPGQRERIAKYGLRDRCAGIRPIAESAHLQELALVDAHAAIEAFSIVARDLIDDGAEILVPGCSLMSSALRLTPGAEEDFPNGVTEVDGVPIADVLGDAIKMAESLVALKRAGSSWISRKSLYAKPSTEARKAAAAVIEERELKFWDVQGSR